MPPKGKKYRVYTFHKILQRWELMASGLTKAQVDVYTKTLIPKHKVEEFE